MQQLVTLLFTPNAQIIISVGLISVEGCKALLFSRKMLVKGCEGVGVVQREAQMSKVSWADGEEGAVS